MITHLSSNQVFVFGSNAQGFHGAGAAGFACRGDHRNNWRADPWFQKAIRSPVGSTDRIGKWAVFGIARGFQQGRDGSSYAIETIKRPGAKRSTSRREIYFQLVELWKYAEVHPESEFLIAPLGTGYAGYEESEMQEIWDYLKAQRGWPSNVRMLAHDK